MNSSTSTSKRQSALWWVLPLLLAALLPVYNLVQDYYGVFGRRDDWRGVIPNERYLKYEAVTERPGEITALLFGSSKAANIPFYRRLGTGAYNFAYSEGLPRDHLEVLRALLDSLPSLQRVYIAVDDMSYLLDPSDHSGDYLRRQHPAVAGQPHWRFILDYLARPLSNTDFLYFTPERLQRPEIIYEFDSSGRSLCPSCDLDIEADPEAHRKQPFFGFPYNPPDNYGIDRLAVDMRGLSDLLEQRGIEMVLLLQPSFANNLRWHNLAMLEELKFMLAGVADFYDFLVYDPALQDPVNFYDVVHFRPNIGDRIMDVLLHSETPQPGEFGYLVTAAGLQQHNARVRDALVGSLVPENKYQQDVDYTAWQARSGFTRDALDGERAEAVLAASGQPVNCRLDSVNRARFLSGPIRLPVEELGMLEFSGWARIAAGRVDGYLAVQEQGAFGSDRVYAFAAGLGRPDVARRFGEAFERAGFRGNIDLSTLRRGNYRLRWLFVDEERWHQCDADIRLVVF